MKTLKRLFERNRAWAAEISAREPGFFRELARRQTPEYLWIGCSDSRVPSTQLVDLSPGEMFVHRNVANVVVHTDLNCLSVMQYAVDEKHADALARCDTAAARLRLLCELNVREQVSNVCRTTIVQGAWERGQELSVHGWLYALEDGLLRDLGVCVTCP